MIEPIIIALDVGGSSVKSGIVDTHLQLHDIQSTALDSKGTAEHILSTFTDVIRHYLNTNNTIKGIGIGFPSPFDYEQGISLIQGVDKYEAILNVNVGDSLREKLNLPQTMPVRFRNDAESALVGEAVYGAGKPYQRFIGVTLGTGMGSSFIVDGQRVSRGVGVPETGFLFPVDFRGQQADEWFSTRGLLARFAEAGKPFASVADASESAHAGDEIAQKAFADFGADMADFLAPFLSEFSAEALLVSGGIAKALPLFGDTLQAGIDVPVVRGSLGTQAALLGAADLILRH